jgi:hypothetical protein
MNRLLALAPLLLFGCATSATKPEISPGAMPSGCSSCPICFI